MATDAQVMTSSKFYTSAFAFLAINGASSVLVSSCCQLEAKLRYMLLFLTCHRKSHELDHACARWNEEKSLKIRTTLHHVHDLFIHNAIITVQDPGNDNAVNCSKVATKPQAEFKVTRMLMFTIYHKFHPVRDHPVH